MEMDEQENEVRSTRRSTRNRSSPSASSPVRSNTRKRGRGRGRGRGRVSRSKVSSEDEQSSERDSDPDSSNSPTRARNHSNGVEFEQGVQMEVDEQNESSSSERTLNDHQTDLANIQEQNISEKSSTANQLDNNDSTRSETDNRSNLQPLPSEAETQIDNLPVKVEDGNSNDKTESGVRRLSNDSTSEEPTPKKPCLEINIRKLLPELEKHWKTVEQDPNDFTAWTYLLQYVDQENELLAAREAYDAFLSRYPYCYGYWKKYADYEKRRGSSSDCEQVFQRGLKAISLSVDLWIHYLNYVKATHEKEPEYIRAQFEAALDACGMEFRSDKLWEHYIHWERENNNLKNVMAIYDQVISMPTQSHATHFQHVKELISQTSPSEILDENELRQIEDTLETKQENEDEDKDTRIRNFILDKRTEMYKLNEVEIAERWAFEEAIKRPYFHVKPLEKGQLKIWKEYLDFEINKGIYKRVITLFERCLIACALYEEYWIKYAKFLQTQTPVDVPKLRDVFTRASTIHHQKKPWVNLHWASFEETQGNNAEAISILENLEKHFPDSLHIQYRRINLERRAGNLSKCNELFQKYIQSAKNKSTTAHITIKYARFLSEIMNDYEGAKKILLDAVDLDDGTRGKAFMALVDIGMQRKPLDVDLIIATFDEALEHKSLSNDQKITFAHRKIEFLEDFSPDMIRIEKAQSELQAISKLLRETKSEDTGRSGEDPSKGTNNGTTYQENNQGSFNQQYNQYGQYSNWNSNQPGGYNSQGWNAYQGYT